MSPSARSGIAVEGNCPFGLWLLLVWKDSDCDWGPADNQSAGRTLFTASSRRQLQALPSTRYMGDLACPSAVGDSVGMPLTTLYIPFILRLSGQIEVWHRSDASSGLNPKIETLAIGTFCRERNCNWRRGERSEGIPRHSERWQSSG
jgi:hypothetical protein